MSENGEAEFGMVMPFVVTESHGGPYHDESFVAGARFAKWDMILKMQPYMHQEYEHPELVPQLDLLAMHLSYKIEVFPYEPDPTWVLVRMTAGGGNSDPDLGIEGPEG